jgi:hypothetical protein
LIERERERERNGERMMDEGRQINRQQQATYSRVQLRLWFLLSEIPAAALFLCKRCAGVRGMVGGELEY